MKKMLAPLAVLVVGQLITSCAQKPVPVKEASTRNPGSSSDKEETPWTTWSKKGTVGGLLVLKHIRENLLENNLHDAHINYSGYGKVSCADEKMTRFRSADGTCTDLNHPYVGAANTAFGRNVPPEFIDHDAADKLRTPDPGLVSKEFFTRSEFKPVPFLNMLAASWIQFMNHDWINHGKNAEKKPMTFTNSQGKTEVVERTNDNPFDESMYKKSFGKVGINTITHWWDGSQVYGSTQDEQNAVRSFSNGKMRTVIINGKELLPAVANLDVHNNKQGNGHEITGFRDNWWVGLSMLHTLFVKEHNYIADMLYKKHVKFDAKTGVYTWKNGKEVLKLTAAELDQHIFGTARLINTAIMAKIHTVEWTPAILANDTLKKGMYSNWYGLANPQSWSRHLKKLPFLKKTDWGINSSYVVGGIVGQKRNDHGVPFNMSEEFVSVYRLHSLLPEALEIKKLSAKSDVKTVTMADTRNEKSYPMMQEYDLKDLYYSFGTQHPGQLVLNNYPKFMQELKIPGLGNMDLGMIDVLRDRERGTPRYNQFRRAIGLKPIARYTDFFDMSKGLDARQKEVLAKFNKIYGKDDSGEDNVEDIDLLVGTLAEEIRPKNFGFGETMFQIFILMASRRLMADRFYTDNYTAEYYTETGLKWIDHEGWMHRVITRHMPELAPHVKGLESAFNPWNK